MISDIKQVEQTLRNLALVAEHATEAIAVIDLSGYLRFVNMAWANMHGYDNRNELIGKPITIFHTEEQLKSDLMAFIEETQQRGRLEGPVEHIRMDGTVFPTVTKMIALKDQTDKVVGLAVFAIDVTDKRKTEELLNQQTVKLNAVTGQLQNQIAECRRLNIELQRCRNQLEQCTAELIAANKELQNQVAERQRVVNELQEYCISVEQQTTELATAINRVIQFAESGTQLFCHKAW